MSRVKSKVHRLAEGPWRSALRAVLWDENQIGYREVDIPRTSRVLTYVLDIQSTRDLRKATSETMAEQIAYAIGVDSVRVVRSRGSVCVEVQLPSEYHKPLLVKSLDRKSKLWVTLGQTTRGNQVHINLGGNQFPHALIAATTGGGKTVAMQLMLWELAMQNKPEDARVLLIDGKGGRDWHGFEGVPHLVNEIVTEPNAAAGALAWAMAEADRRKTAGGYHPALLVLVDEVAEILSRTGGANGAAAQALKSLTQVGRSLNIRVLLATQHPTAEVLGGSLAKANLPLRLVGRVMDASASTLATGQKGVGCHVLYGQGDFIAVSGSVSHRFQMALVDERFMTRLPRNGSERHEIDLTLDLSRVIDVAGPGAGSEPQVPARMAAWALWDSLTRKVKPSATAIKKQFSVGTPRAQAIRDYVIEFSDNFDHLGGASCLLPPPEE